MSSNSQILKKYISIISQYYKDELTGCDTMKQKLKNKKLKGYPPNINQKKLLRNN